MKLFDPRFGLVVSRDGIDVTDVFLEAAERIQFSQSMGEIDLIKATLSNPYHSATRKKVFQPGGVIELWAGWNQEMLSFLGAGEIDDWLGRFTTMDMPKIEIVAHGGGIKLTRSKDDYMFIDRPLSEAAKDIANKHKFMSDIDPTTSRSNYAKQSGTNDWEWLSGLAGLVGYDFFVKWDVNAKNWVLHWHDQRSEQDSVYIFKFNQDSQQSTLYSIDISYGINYESYDQIKLWAWNGEEYIEIKTEDALLVTDYSDPASQDVTFFPDEYSKLRIGIDDSAFDIPLDTSILNADEAFVYADNYLKQMKRQLITATGKIIGIEDLAPRQVHRIEGIEQFSGDWFFTKVDHIFDSNGYNCTFSANRVLVDDK